MSLTLPWKTLINIMPYEIVSRQYYKPLLYDVIEYPISEYEIENLPSSYISHFIRLEGFHKEETKNQLTFINLKYIKSIQSHNDWINSLSIFPSGNIISVSNDKSINTYDITLNILQNIPNTHDDSIIYVEIKDENNLILVLKIKILNYGLKKIINLKLIKLFKMHMKIK